MGVQERSMLHRHLYGRIKALLSIVILSISGGISCQMTPDESTENFQAAEINTIDPIVQEIVFIGNKHTNSDALRAKLPFKEGERFNRLNTGKALKNIYQLGLFKPGIKLFLEPITDDTARLVVELEEKDILDGIVYVGNDHLKEKDIDENLHFNDKKTIDEAELNLMIDQLKQQYRAKDYHHATITADIIPTTPGHAKLQFTINEGYPSYVKRVFFKGNNCIPSKKLRSLLFTREEWLFGFLKKAGSYQPDALEYDKHVIENFYQSNGFMTAKVTDIDVQEIPSEHRYIVTFTIEEGDIYTVEEVKAVGNDVLNEQEILIRTPLRPGELYSRERIRLAMDQLRLIWGEFGYIYAEVHPMIDPHPERKTVSITFNTDLGNKIIVNRISVIGNKKTRDYVIRRNIIFDEGELLTTFKMDESKRRVEQLGYFDPKNGVNWRIIKIDENTADLELIVQETKTGQFYSQIGFGGLGTTDPKKSDPESERRDDAETKESPSTSFKVGLGIKDTNLWGTGVLWNINGIYSEQERNLLINISNPWMLNKPISSGFDLAVRNVQYEEFRNVTNTPVEKSASISGNVGFRAKRLGNALTVIDTGYEKIDFTCKPDALVPLGYEQFKPDLQFIINQRFKSGDLVWVGLSLAQDMRNHPVYPTRGYQWAFNSRVAIPHGRDTFAFFKTELDGRWYTPVIEQYDLVFHLHGHLGFVKAFPGSSIPYRELFNMGGPTTVRGFIFGQIGPNIVLNPTFGTSPIGATKEFFINAELQFPIKLDMSIRGVLFYDGGAGWDTPDACCINPLILRNNNFNYRHSIGFGVRLTYPTPVRIDWGFKLDRNKRRGETASEMHFTVLQEF